MVDVGVDTNCRQFRGVDGAVEAIPAPHLESNHPEADTRICLNAIDADLSIQQPSEIVVTASDPDVAVILLHHCHRMKSNMWMEVGNKGKGDRRFLNISAIAAEVGVGPMFCEALPGFHAYTGCDYTSSFVRKGKKRPLKIAEDNPDYLDAFSSLSTVEADERSCKIIEEYTAKIYGAKKLTSLNKHRLIRF